MFRVLFTGAAVIMIIFSGSFPVEAASKKSIIEYSKRLYKAGKYDATIRIIRKYLRKNGKSSKTEHLVPIIIEALIRQNEYSSAHRLGSMYRLRFPQAAYNPRIWYVEGVAFAKQEKFPQAVNAFSAALNKGVSPKLDSLIVKNTEKICIYMAPDEFSELSAQKLNEVVAEVIAYYQIRKLVALGQFAKAQATAKIFRDQFPGSRYNRKLSEQMSKAREAEKSIIQIGILAPVSGDEEEIGKRVVLGAQLAVSHLQPSGGQQVKTVVMDTKGNMITTARKTQELLDQHKVSVIVGPVLSQTATVTAAMLTNRAEVMISPTATDEGIAEIGENVFQMNVTIGVLGKKIARYAMDNLSIKDFVIMAPQTLYGQILAESFKEEVKERNLEIVAEEYYEEGANDYRENFNEIRRKLLLRHLERIAVEKGTDFTGELSRRDSILYKDSTFSVGGFFMPADAEDIVMLAPQVMFHRLRTQLLGSSGWYQKRVLKDGRKYVTNAVISTSFELDQNTDEWKEFVTLYKSRYNSTPDRIAALGYDAASLIMNAIREAGTDDPVRIREKLSETNRYRGISGMITFEDGRRANSETAVYKLSSDKFVRVQ